MSNETVYRRSSLSEHYYAKPYTIPFPALHIVAEENNVDDCDLSSASSRLSCWGSTESRRSYSCLKSLSEGDSLSRRETVPMPNIDGGGWGYFVDTIDDV